MAADVATTLPTWSTTRASNQPQGTTTVGTNWDDNIREIQGVVRAWLANKGADIASAGTTDLGAVEGSAHDITGTTTITGFGTISSGIIKYLKFEGALTLTHNATSLILPGGASITTADGDMLMASSEGSGNWRVNWYVKVNGQPLVATPFVDTNPIVIGSADATKKVRIEADGITTGTTRVWTASDIDVAIGKQPTRQVLTSGTAATYTTPSGATRINIRMVGGGGGGSGGGGNGGNATASTWSGGSLSAGGGSGAVAATPGAGGTSSNGDINLTGATGNGTTASVANAGGGSGANSVFGGGGSPGLGNAGGAVAGGAGVTNTGGGGGSGGAGGGSAPNDAGGGAGGYCEKLIVAPAATYTYTVGAAGSAGAGSGTVAAGGPGGTGIIIVDEYYN